VARDERPRPGLTTERLARLRPAFRSTADGGTVTAGNSCGVNDGAAAVAMVDADTHRRHGVPGLRVLATATAGVDPNLPGLGLVPAVEQALAEAGIKEFRLRLTDYGGLPPDVLDEAVREVSVWLDAGDRTYVHCRAGWQRSAAVAAAVVATHEGIDIEDALEYVQSRKRSADPLPHQRDDLRRWWAARTAAK